MNIDFSHAFEMTAAERSVILFGRNDSYGKKRNTIWSKWQQPKGTYSHSVENNKKGKMSITSDGNDCGRIRLHALLLGTKQQT